MPIVSYLRDLRWDVHQEVQPGYGWGIADIVAVQGPVLWVIECKMTLSIAVMSQAEGWIRHACANVVSVAVPRPLRASTDRDFAYRVCERFGVGVLVVDSGYVHVGARPRFWRPTGYYKNYLRDSLSDQTRTYAAAGSTAGAHFTAFKGTCQSIVTVLRETPGLTTRELVEKVNHHYASDSSARSSLVKWLREGIIPGVRGVGEHPMRWQLEEKQL